MFADPVKKEVGGTRSMRRSASLFNFKD
jgi:hypothetical protein